MDKNYERQGFSHQHSWTHGEVEPALAHRQGRSLARRDANAQTSAHMGRDGRARQAGLGSAISR
eukprot:6177988-Pleurochrysis_carterae.AAC.1